jgi:hypothetical protein
VGPSAAADLRPLIHFGEVPDWYILKAIFAAMILIHKCHSSLSN